MGSADDASAKVVQLKDGEGKSGSLKHTFEQGYYTVSVSEHPSLLAAMSGRDVVGEITQELVVKYVRRELRTLDEEDRDKTMDVMATLWKVSTEEGQALYGPDYQGMDTLLKFHLMLAGAQDCDHFHQGYGFLTQHGALSDAFEQSMQAIDPTVTLPYWDYTVDLYLWAANDNYDYLNSGIFTPEYFGGVDTKTNHIANGRWKDLKIPLSRDLIKDDPELAMKMPSNIYGHARGPWSNNMDPYVERRAESCGLTTMFKDKHTMCNSYAATLKETDFSEFNHLMESLPHGPAHHLSGGTMNCKEGFDALVPLLGQSYVDDLKVQAFGLHKEMWRIGLMDCANYADCRCPDMDDWINDKAKVDGLSYLMDTVQRTEIYSLPYEHQQAVLAAICTPNMVTGDQLQASSAYGPEFWPIHPFVSRMVQFKLMKYPFPGGVVWPEKASWKPNQEDCFGHHSYDPVLGGLLPLKVNGQDTYLTNEEYFARMDPTYDTGSRYIYDNFDFDFCKDANSIDLYNLVYEEEHMYRQQS
eukprot:CAMPEP_0113938470 /NCGR_PEP_ID=MMETSP1339-20121228/4898_1 /TAXON_ID=94617 /ORGANISM="Fibrocapsa japonica" /LENGTH=526 /DNA_ID=CAMNT_0000941603 /DNA_START=412 /DNA_END=1992 /DNA_ORIENTATION=+ /assembly_acc=CAM_ASM_000762